MSIYKWQLYREYFMKNQLLEHDCARPISTTVRIRAQAHTANALNRTGSTATVRAGRRRIGPLIMLAIIEAMGQSRAQTHRPIAGSRYEKHDGEALGVRWREPQTKRAADEQDLSLPTIRTSSCCCPLPYRNGCLRIICRVSCPMSLTSWTSQRSQSATRVKGAAVHPTIPK